MGGNKQLSSCINLKHLAMIMAVLLGEWVDSASAGGRGGTWVLLRSAGAVAMHMAVTHRNTVILFDQTEAGHPLTPPNQACSPKTVNASCWAHSFEYHISTNTIRPLTLKTDTWCSSGSFLSNGTLLQTGGHGNGSKVIRHFQPCSDEECDWVESNYFLSRSRWYASDQLLPDNRVIVVGGRRTNNYEFVPKTSQREGSYDLPFLHKTENKGAGWENLYPFLHLSSDGNLFIFANRDSILFDYTKGTVLKTFPPMPGSGGRSYPSSGSSVMLPLSHENDFQKVEIMICGGAARGAFIAAGRGRFLKGQSSCGRMVITAPEPAWAMEDMPAPRLMNDMLILPCGDILIINGAKRGAAGWNNAKTPSLSPYLYEPTKSRGSRFSVMNGTDIPRMYHSSAVILPDGRVLVGGSNAHKHYTFKGVEFPTELRLQAFVPYHMDEYFDDRRPSFISILREDGGKAIRYGEEFRVLFSLRRKPNKVVVFHAYSPSFTTHSVSMNQRMLRLRCKRMEGAGGGAVIALLEAPPSPNVAPPGYYMLTIVNGGIPSRAIWLRFADA